MATAATTTIMAAIHVLGLAKTVEFTAAAMTVMLLLLSFADAATTVTASAMTGFCGRASGSCGRAPGFLYNYEKQGVIPLSPQTSYLRETTAVRILSSIRVPQLPEPQLPIQTTFSKTELCFWRA